MNEIENLKKYKELLDLEIITQEEFNQKKAELLGLEDAAIIPDNQFRSIEDDEVSEPLSNSQHEN